MANSRILAAIFAATLTAARLPGAATGSDRRRAGQAGAPAKESFRTWTWNKVSGNWKRMARRGEGALGQAHP